MGPKSNTRNCRAFGGVNKELYTIIGIPCGCLMTARQKRFDSGAPAFKFTNWYYARLFLTTLS